jgi:hypothetical protein
LFLSCTTYLMSQKPIVPVEDPRLKESMTYENI